MGSISLYEIALFFSKTNYFFLPALSVAVKVIVYTHLHKIYFLPFGTVIVVDAVLALPALSVIV
jgi:hypothetical protein